jgi:hypothetical protein
MTLGPLEYTIIGFEGNRFNGDIAREIAKVVDAGVVRLVDVVFITKDVDGSAAVVELDGKDDPRFAGFTPMLEGLSGLLTPDDLEQLAAGLPVNTSALVLLFEHHWAVEIKEAIQDAGGFLIARETVAPEALEMLNAEVEAGLLSA